MKKVLVVCLMVFGMSLPTFALTSDELIDCVKKMTPNEKEQLFDTLSDYVGIHGYFARNIYAIRDYSYFQYAIEHAIRNSSSIQNTIRQTVNSK